MFSHTSRIVAVLALLGGLVQIAIGIAIAIGWVVPADLALERYAGGSTTAEVINRGTYIVLFALALGTLAEIAIVLRRSRA